MLMALIIIVMNFAADLIYGLLDPRVAGQKEGR